MTYTKEEQERIDASNKLRRELLPVDLIARVSRAMSACSLDMWRKKKNRVDWTLARMMSAFLSCEDGSLHHGDFSFWVWNGLGE